MCDESKLHDKVKLRAREYAKKYMESTDFDEISDPKRREAIEDHITEKVESVFWTKMCRFVFDKTINDKMIDDELRRIIKKIKN
jgi:hypothetical protein